MLSIYVTIDKFKDKNYQNIFQKLYTKVIANMYVSDMLYQNVEIVVHCTLIVSLFILNQQHKSTA